MGIASAVGKFALSRTPRGFLTSPRFIPARITNGKLGKPQNLNDLVCLKVAELKVVLKDVLDNARQIDRSVSLFIRSDKARPAVRS